MMIGIYSLYDPLEHGNWIGFAIRRVVDGAGQSKAPKPML